MKRFFSPKPTIWFGKYLYIKSGKEQETSLPLFLDKLVNIILAMRIKQLTHFAYGQVNISALEHH